MKLKNPGFARVWSDILFMSLERFKINGRRLETVQNRNIKVDSRRLSSYTTLVVSSRFERMKKRFIDRNICLRLQHDLLHAAFHKRDKRVF
jgi:hypothetical protein